jgi:short-subunit dehydrogenase
LFGERADAETASGMRFRLFEMDAATAARIGYKALAKGKTTEVAGLATNLSMFLMRLMPRKLVTKVASLIMKPT